jgi:hypothetical protein
MTLGKVPAQQDLFQSSSEFCGGRLSPTSIYALLHRECHRLFPDEAFADLFQGIGRDSVPPRIVAVVMVLQRIEGLSDREAVDHFAFDLRWKYAAGGLDFDHPGFVHTVLVDMRARLRRSTHPDRIFEAALEVAKSAGLVGRKRVLDSTALYDAVATQDTVTMIRSAIRGLLQAADEALAQQLRGVLKRDDDYATAGKPACEWDDKQAREALVDALARDAQALLLCLDGRELPPEVKQAAALVATVVGQDLDQAEGGMFRIARRVAPDRVISTVDPEARHGHKTQSRSFDGYKGHVAVDPDSEIIVKTEVTPGNTADGAVTEKLLSDVLSNPPEANKAAGVEAYGDASYGTAEVVEKLEGAGIEANVKVQAPSAPKGMYSKQEFAIDPENKTVRCPAGHTVEIAARKDGGGLANFGALCAGCPLREKCTSSKDGRQIHVHPRESVLKRAREGQKAPEWKAKYRSTRPKVERKFGQLMRRRHGGRRARVRGCVRVGHDFALLAAAANLKRLAALGVRHDGTGWRQPA